MSDRGRYAETTTLRARDLKTERHVLFRPAVATGVAQRVTRSVHRHGAASRRDQASQVDLLCPPSNPPPSSLSQLAVLRMNMSPTATGGFSCCAEPRSIERNLRFVRGLCLTPTGC